MLVWGQGEGWGVLRAADCGGACCRGGPGPWCPPVSWLSQPVSENSPASQTAALRRLWGREERRGPLFSILILISISGSISLLAGSLCNRSFHYFFFLSSRFVFLASSVFVQFICRSATAETKGRVSIPQPRQRLRLCLFPVFSPLSVKSKPRRLKRGVSLSVPHINPLPRGYAACSRKAVCVCMSARAR